MLCTWHEKFLPHNVTIIQNWCLFSQSVFPSYELSALHLQLDDPQLAELALEMAEGAHMWAGQAIQPSMDGLVKLPEHHAVRLVRLRVDWCQ